MGHERNSTRPDSSPPEGNLWRNADFLKLWSAQTVSVIGSLLGALQFTAILVLDAGPAHLSLLTAAGTLPALLMGFPIGTWVDRLNRRSILIGADLVRMALLGSIPVAWAVGVLTMEQLYAVAFSHGLATMFFDVAYRSYLPALVDSKDLVLANSRLSATSSVAEVGAFSLGGWIAQLFSAIVVTVLDSVTFLVSALLLSRIRRHEGPSEPRNRTSAMRQEIVAGLRVVARNRILRAIAVSKGAMGLGGGVIGTLIILYGIDILGFEPGVLGTISAVGGVSSIVGALNVHRLARRYGVGRTLVAGFLVYGLSGFLIPLARGPLWAAGALLTSAQLFDFSLVAYEVNEVSLRQSVTPRRMLGRVNASLEVTTLGFHLVGALLAGVLAQALGMRWALFVGSWFMVSGGVWLLLSPVWRQNALPDAA